jgi:carbon monoxide dehydrogenase subunit G
VPGVQVKGQTTIKAARGEVWSTLTDPDALRRCLPGCQRFDEVAPNEWEAALTVGLASIKGSYTGRVRISDQEPQRSYRLSVEGNGGGSRIRGAGLVTLEDAADGGATVVSYDGDAQVMGTLAAVGQRLLQPAARMLADQFFACIGTRLKE